MIPLRMQNPPVGSSSLTTSRSFAGRSRPGFGRRLRRGSGRGRGGSAALARQLPRPDVVLLDANLWDANPWRLLDDLREVSPRCRFLILLVAGQEVALPPWDRVDVIRKPFDLPAVVRLVEAAASCPSRCPKVAV